MSKVSDPFLRSHCHLNVDPALFLVLFSWMLTLCVPFNDMVIPSPPSHVLSRSIYVMWEKNVHHCVCVCEDVDPLRTPLPEKPVSESRGESGWQLI